MITESPRKGKKYPKVPLTKREVSRMWGQVVGESDREKMDAAAFALMWRCGLRNAEVCALTLADIDLGEGIVHVMHGKGDKHRSVAMDEKTVGVIRDWVDVRGDGELLFVRPETGTAVYPQYLIRMVRAAAENAEVKKVVSPHTLRHTHAFELLGEGVDPMTIKEQLGHADLAATMVYLNHLNPKERHDRMKGREW